MKCHLDYLEEAEHSTVGQRKEEEEDEWGGSGPETSELILLQNIFIAVQSKAILWLRWLTWKRKRVQETFVW